MIYTFSTANLPPTKIAQHAYIFIPTTTTTTKRPPFKTIKKKSKNTKKTSTSINNFSRSSTTKTFPPTAPGRSPGHCLPHHLPQRGRDTWRLDVGEPTAAATGKRQIVLKRHRWFFGSWWGEKRKQAFTKKYGENRNFEVQLRWWVSCVILFLVEIFWCLGTWVWWRFDDY